MYDIPFDRSFLQLSDGTRNVMPSTDRKLELTAKASMAQPVSQPAVCSNGLRKDQSHSSTHPLGLHIFFQVELLFRYVLNPISSIDVQ